MGVQLVPISMTLNDLDRRSGRYFTYTAFGSFGGQLVDEIVQLLAIYDLWRYSRRFLRTNSSERERDIACQKQ